MKATTKIVINAEGSTNLRKNSQRTAVLNALFGMVNTRSQRPIVDAVIAAVKKSRAKALNLTPKQVRMALCGLHRSGFIRVVSGNKDAWVKFDFIASL